MLFSDVVRGYTNLWRTCRLKEKQGGIDCVAATRAVVDKVVANRERYEAVAKKVGCPWWFIGGIHNLEASGSFKKHLHNGDPLTARTTHVPANRPAAGEPPFTWEESAIDALTMPPHSFQNVEEWHIPRALWEWERYNGLGYFGKGPSPYLWSMTNHYEKGKYVADHDYDANAVSEQVGAAAVLRMLVTLGIVADTTPDPGVSPMAETSPVTQPLSEFLKSLPPAIAVTAPTIISMAEGPSAPMAIKALAEALPGPVAPTAQAVEDKIHSMPVVGDILGALAAAERAITGVLVPSSVPATGETIQTTETTNIPPPPLILGPILVGFDALFPALVGFKTPAAIIIAGIACALHYSGLVPSPEVFATALSLASALGGIGIIQKIDRAGSSVAQIVGALRPAKTISTTKV